jgi:hypothetical protein
VLATSVAAAIASGASVADAAEQAAADAEPQADLNASVEYRQHLAKVLTRAPSKPPRAESTLFSGGDNPLFATDVQAGDFLEVVSGGPTGFLVASIVAAIAIYFLWRKEAKPLTRVFLVLGAFFSASFFYNLVDAVRVARG